jgi:uncharacterized RDD family membrane protein YckC
MPESKISTQSDEGQLVTPIEVQGLVIRTFAFLVDVLIIVTAVLIIYYILGIPISSDSSSMKIVYPVVFFLYMMLMEGESGQTLGKKFFKIKVVADDGSPLTFGRVFIRNVIGIFDRSVIGAVIIWFSKRRQRLGDMAAKSIVVKVK